MSYIHRSCYSNNSCLHFTIESYPKVLDKTIQISLNTNDFNTPVYLNIDTSIEYFKQVVQDLENYKIKTQSRLR